MIYLPHRFSSFIQGDRPPSLVLGAGVSLPDVPGPSTLLKNKKKSAEDKLGLDYGCNPVDVDVSKADSLYVWADKILDQLQKKVPGQEKLILAKELGLLTDPCWGGRYEEELAGTAAKHRVIARFAKEGLWRSIWSLNWDTLFESALKRIGLVRGTGIRSQPWPTLFSINITNNDLALNAPNHIVAINKPHGCVYSLLEAEEKFKTGDEVGAKELCQRLMIGKRELSVDRKGKNPHDDAFFEKFDTELREAPLSVIGWSISEPTLQGAFDAAVRPRTNSNVIEEFTLIDPYLNDNHKAVLQCYGLTEKEAHFCIEKDEAGYNVNRLLLWVQARYVLKQIKKWALSPWDDEIAKEIASLDDGNCPTLLCNFADHFIPVWVRLCWRLGTLDCADYNPEDLDLDLPDEHVPLRGIAATRSELRAAAGLLYRLLTGGDEWDLASYSGGLYDRKTARLVVPLPAWNDPDKFNGLRGLAPFLRRLEKNAGSIEHVSILPLCDNPDIKVTEDRIAHLKDLVAQESRVPRFADSKNWDIAENLMSVDGGGK